MSDPTGYAPSPAAFAVLTSGQAREHLVERQEAFAAALAGGDLDAPVAACPGWALRELAWHLGTVHRWVVGAVTEGRPLSLEETGPVERAALVDWYRSAAHDLADLLARTPDDTPCWHFGPKPRTARFWSRRQAHETAMHALDAAVAVGGPAGYPAALALDGLDEVVTVFFPRQVSLGRTEPQTRSLALAPAEVDGVRWVLSGDGTAPVHEGPADATLHGPAAVLLQVLWKRLPSDVPEVTVEGDPGAVGAVLAARLTP
jgi:uncharacterized protein (TIGR03083 family)